jgi:hypothetical protein
MLSLHRIIQEVIYQNMNNNFEFIPASIWAHWPVTTTTFYGNSGNYIIYQDTFYFFWDGTHVGTQKRKTTLWNPNAKLPRGYKKTVKELSGLLPLLIVTSN